MRLDIPELERLSAEQRQEIVERAVRLVNATHGRMGKVPHYVGCALTAAVALFLAITNRGYLVAALVGVPVYGGSILIGFIFWRRAMFRHVQSAIREAIATRTQP